jgi:hypothetical protein
MESRTREEIWREFEAELFSKPIPRVPPNPKPKPKPRIELEVSPRIAEAVKAAPESVRVSARAEEMALVERARPTEIIHVLEVDEAGRPKLSRRVDCATGEASLVEYRDGYRQAPGAHHEYDPFAVLKRD